MWPSSYYSGRYWPDAFFAGHHAGAAVVVPRGRDWDIYQDIEKRLIDTGEFGYDCVQIGHPADADALLPADRTAAALITPGDRGRDDDDRADEELRTGTYTLTLSARHEPRGRYQVLDRLGDVAQNALDGQSLAGLTYRSMTKLGGGRYGAPRDDEQELTLSGTFRYRVIGHDAHDATAREDE